MSASSTSGLTNKESLAISSFNVVLKSKQTSDVTIRVKSQKKTVDDTIRDRDIIHRLDLASAGSKDLSYDGMPISNVWETNHDRNGGSVHRPETSCNLVSQNVSSMASLDRAFSDIEILLNELAL